MLPSATSAALDGSMAAQIMNVNSPLFLIGALVGLVTKALTHFKLGNWRVRFEKIKRLMKRLNEKQEQFQSKMYISNATRKNTIIII